MRVREAQVSAMQAAALEEARAAGRRQARAAGVVGGEAGGSYELLQRFFYDFGGPEWALSYGWLEGRDPCCIPGTSPCRAWYGLECAYDGPNATVGVVENVLFSDNNLNGKLQLIEDSLCQMPHLVTLAVLNENITGTLPQCLASMPALLQLYLSNLNLEPQPLPLFLASMKQLQVLALAAVNLVGPIPDEAAALTGSVFSLILSDNTLTGTIPEWLSHAGNLTSLVLRCNALEGTIPPSLFARKFALLDLSQNKLNGSIPDAFLPYQYYVSLDLSHNQLEGTLPPTIGYVASSYFPVNITLAGNMLSGGVDVLFPAYSKLARLNLASNRFYGTIPAAVGLASNLSELVLSDNKLFGTIPAEIGNMGQLELLNLADNEFTAIDRSMTLYTIPKLRQVSLRGNRLTWLPPLVYLDVVVEDNKVTQCAYTSLMTFLDVSGNPIRPLSGGRRLRMGDILSMLIASDIGVESALLSCVQGLQTGYARLKTLALAQIGLSGSLMPTIFEVFPGISHLDLQGNNLGGPLPQSTTFFSFTLPFSLEFLDLSNNALSGSLPAVYGPALETNLQFLGLLDGNFVCPGLTAPHSRAQIHVDATYYHRTLCRCSPRFWGKVQADGSGCHSLATYCDDEKECIVHAPSANETVSVASTAVVVSKGYWPSPSADAAVLLIRCTSLPVPADQIACNPAGRLECTPNIVRGENGETLSKFSCKPVDEVCRWGHSERLCGKCETGFFRTAVGCRQCTGLISSPWTLVFGLIFFFIFMGLAILIRTRDPSPQMQRIREHFHEQRTLREFLTAYRGELIQVTSLYVSFCVAVAFVEPSWVETMLALFATTYYVVYSLLRKSLPPDEGGSGRGDGRNERTALLARAHSDGQDDRDAVGGFLGETPVRDVREALAVASGVFKSFVVYFQTLAAVTNGLVVWPKWGSFIVALNKLLVSVAPLVCQHPSLTYQDMFLIVMLLPLGLVVAISVLFGVWVVYQWLCKIRMVASVKSSDDGAVRVAVAHKLFAVRVRTAGQVLFAVVVLTGYIMFFPVMSTYFELYACSRDNTPLEQGKQQSISYMTTVPWIRCFNSHEYFSMYIPGSLLMVVYVAGFVWVFHLLNAHHRGGELRHGAVRLQYSILFESFRRGAWWFEKVLTVRRALLALAVAGSATASLSSIGVTVVLTISLAIQGWYAPYSTSLGNLAEIVGLCSVIFSFLVTQSALRVYQASSASEYKLEGIPEVLNNVAVYNALATFAIYGLVAILPFLRLVPSIRARNWRIFHILGLGRPEGKATPAVRAGATTGARWQSLMVSMADLPPSPQSSVQNANAAAQAELETLRARVAELERDARDRATAALRVSISFQAEMDQMRAKLAKLRATSGASAEELVCNGGGEDREAS
ncbi:Hcr2-0A [Thecamonas trahens ATCC 50062]|uniref:Hcr2-0A n=1 Tax=Thecamonas trahens ATCC 50062 TaxID=461836 RepID=A0A0L0DP52_THETB|nr:Hcr2-0A [Thecamonas trahens ATCC 50062]KNC54055.1 Hcr2-0A [Thecamonas trahens ATCC 50062]|eukprot:XP_013754066.1 Hcr2-0A [Thecamonas trahens ATCC 50062]